MMAVRFLEVEMRRAPRLARGLALRHFASASPQASGVADDAIIRQFAARRQTGVSLRTLLDTGSGLLVNGQVRSGGAVPPEVLMRVGTFLHRELPIRMAHRVRDLDSIPSASTMPSVLKVREWYARSLAEIMAAESPGGSAAAEADFARVLDAVYQRHAAVLYTMAIGVYELREKRRAQLRSAGASSRLEAGATASFEDADEIHAFLDSFYMSRIGIRMLIGQYLALREPPEPGHTGLIAHATSPAEVIRAAIADARYMCERQHGDAPDVQIHGRLDLTFAYVPTHLHYVLLELIKNSMRATVEFHTPEGGIADSAAMPPIRVVIADGEENEDIAIKVSDEGGGIKRSHMPRIWSYLFTTADPHVQRGFLAEEDGGGGEGTSVAPYEPLASGVAGGALAGLGYGLPISRLYARYFGGDLDIKSMEGYGTDAFVHLSRLGDHDEPLP